MHAVRRCISQCDYNFINVYTEYSRVLEIFSCCFSEFICMHYFSDLSHSSFSYFVFLYYLYYLTILCRYEVGFVGKHISLSRMSILI